MRPLSYQSDKTFVAHGLVALAAGTKASEATNASTNPPMTRRARRAAEKCGTRMCTTPTMEWSPANERTLRRACTRFVLPCRGDDGWPPCQRPTVDPDPRPSGERRVRSDPREDDSSCIDVAVPGHVVRAAIPDG